MEESWSVFDRIRPSLMAVSKNRLAGKAENELIYIACIHTECVLTTIHIECAFSQSTSMGGLKLVSYQIAGYASLSYTGA